MTIQRGSQVIKPSHSFVSSNKPDEEIHVKPFAKMHKKRTRWPRKQRSATTVAQIVGTVWTCTDHRWSWTDARRPNCTAGTLKWETDSVTMQNITNHVSRVSRCIWEGWKSNKLEDKVFQESNTMSISWPWRLSRKSERQRIAERNLRQEEQAHPSSSSSSSPWEFVVEQILTMEGLNPRLLQAKKSSSASDDPPKADTRAGRWKYQSQVRSGPPGTEGRATCSFPIPQRTSANANTSSLRNIAKHTKEEPRSRWTASETTLDYRAVFMEQGAFASKVAAARFLDKSFRLFFWHCWWGQRRGVCSNAVGHVGSTKNTAIARKGMPKRVAKRATKPKTQTIGRDGRTSGSLRTKPVPSPFGKIAVGQKVGWSSSQTQLGTRTNLENTENQNYSSEKMWTTSRSWEDATCGTQVENYAKNIGNTHTAQTRLLFLHTLSPVASTAMFVSQDFSIRFQPTVVEVSAVCLRRTDILDTLWLTLWYRVTYCDGSTRKGKSSCVHNTLVPCAHHALRCFVVTEEIHLFMVMSQNTIQSLAETCWWETAKPRRLLQEELSQEVWWALHSHPFRDLYIIFTTL